MPAEDLISFDAIMSGADPSTETSDISFEDIMSGGDVDESDPIFFNDIVDEFSVEDPETLYHAMKQNPGRAYSDEQVDAFLEYSIEKGFDPYKVIDGMISSVIPIVKDYATSVLDTAKFAATHKGRFVPTGVSAGPGAPGGYWVQDQETDNQSISASLAEGALRGASELGVLGASIGFAQSLYRYESESPGYSKFGASRRKRKTFGQFSEEEKTTARNKFRALNKLLADQLKYQEGEATILGDVVGSFVASGATRPNEFVSTGFSAGPGAPGGYWKQSPGYTEEDVSTAGELETQILSMVNPATANLASYHLGVEGLGAAISKGATKKSGSNIIKSATSEAVMATGSGAAEVGKALEGVEQVTNKVKDLPFVGDPARSLSAFRSAVNRVSDMMSGLSRAIARTSDENVFLSMSRDTFVDPKNRKLAEKLGHGVFTDYPWLSPALRILASPTKVMLAGMSRATGGALSGAGLSALTMDEEMIAQNIIGSGMIAFGGGAYDQAVWGNKQKVAAAANNWLLKQTPEIQQKIKDRGFDDTQIARWAVFERFAQQMVLASTGEADVNFVYTDASSFDTLFDYLRSEGLADNINLDNVTEYAEKIASNSAADKIPSLNRGVQFLNTRNGGKRPIALINVDEMTPTTIIHEGIHALGRLDVLQDYFRPIQDYINRKFTPEDLDKFYSDYMSRFEQSDEMRLRAYDERLADNYQTGTPEADPRFWKHARIKDEIMSDIWESFLTDKDPLYLTRADLKTDANKVAKPLGRLANVLATFMGYTGNPKVLSQTFRDRSGKAVDYGDNQLTAEINNLINFQQRLRLDDDGKVIRGEVSESDSGTITDTSSLDAKSVPKNLLIAKLDQDGNYQFDARGKLVIEKNQKELRKKERLRKNFLRTVFQDQDYRPEAGWGNKVPMNWDPETETISGDYIPDAALAKIRNAPRWLFPPSLIETMERVNESIRRGEPIVIDYNARLVPKGKTGAEYSSKIGSSLRTSIPFGLYISKAGNLLYNTVDLGHLSEKYVRIMQDPQRRKAITNLWSQEADPQATRAAFDRDLVQYLNNMANPDSSEGVLKGLGDPAIARKKANVLSAFLGFKKKDIQFRNNAQRQRILLEHLNPDRADNLIRGRRLDAINDVSPAQLDKMPLNRDAYRRIQENFEPGGMGALDTGEGAVIKRVQPPSMSNLVTLDKIREYISSSKVGNVKENVAFSEGVDVGLRLDIPAYERSIKSGDPVFPVSVHEKWAGKEAGRAGKIIGYTNIATVESPVLTINEVAAEKISKGAPKSTIATVEGKYVHTTNIPSDISAWTQVAMNPRRHSYFYDRATGSPVVAGDKAIVYGNTVFVQNPVFSSEDRFLFEPGQSSDLDSLVISESSVRKMDVGDKTKKQVGLSIADYPKNPVKDSVALPARLGVVNQNIAGVPKSYKEVLNIVKQQVDRIAAVRKEDPEFAKRSAGFYEDMARVGMNVAESIKPVGRSQYDTADLIIRLIALGSPRSSVSSNASKSVRSFMSPFGAPAGYKLGMGTAQRGAQKTANDWHNGKHFDVLSEDAVGADDKVRNFYLNAMADLIDMARADGDQTEVKRLTKRVAQTLGLHKSGEMTQEIAEKTQTFLDGLATVDMWDMASKGYAHPAYIIKRGRKYGSDKPFQWSVPEQRERRRIDDPLFEKALKESPIMVMTTKGKQKPRPATSIMELDYQYARAFQIDGKRDWNKLSWEDRKAEGFDPDTEWSYYKRPDEGGLSPGGSGPVYDAQQTIDGLIADEMNLQGLAGFYGKEKLKARNAQEILWAVEKRDNPLLSNRNLELFGDRLNTFTETLKKMFAGEDWATNMDEKSARAVELINDTFNSVADQTIPIEVTSMGTSSEAKAIQSLQADLGVEAMTEAVADGLAEELQAAIDVAGGNALINVVRTGQGVNSKGEAANVAPHIVIGLRGDPSQTKTIMNALSLAWDQKSGNIIRPATLEERAAGTGMNTAIQFDTRKLDAAQKKAFYEDLSALKDADGNTFLTGFTETPEGMFIGDQFYDGDMQKAIKANRDTILSISDKYDVPQYDITDIVIETFDRPVDEAGRNAVFETNETLARAVFALGKSRIDAAREKASKRSPGKVDERLDVVGRSRRIASETEGPMLKSHRDDLLVRLSEPIDVMALDGLLEDKEVKAIKSDLKKLVSAIPLAKKAKKKPLKKPKKKVASKGNKKRGRQ